MTARQYLTAIKRRTGRNSRYVRQGEIYVAFQDVDSIAALYNRVVHDR